ncbi:MAG: putative zinc-binding metallopeptidase [Thermoanaerobaculia bacterium]|nr:putative zinc-binding metallopeptidase [Thermoanaerobaculia bacterium]
MSEPEVPPVAAAVPASPRPTRRRRQPLAAAEWAAWDDERLLGLRFRDLDLPLGAELEQRIALLHEELAARGLAFRPHCWLSDEWFTPDGVPGIAVPFYLAHPRLARLELHQMLEVEGGSVEWCMKILRHEAGHAIENAYHLRRRRKRRELFGSTREAYPEFYAPRPYSKSFVIHLDSWYAQAHPDEDFAETFAVWLDPQSNWRERYEGWPALRKLEYMDELMRELAGRPPRVTEAREVDPLPTLGKTLRRHYEEKREHYGVSRPEFYDRDLRRLFSDAPEHARQPTAASFLVRARREMRQLVGRWTNEYQYTIDSVLGDMIARCRELNLRLRTSPEQTRLDFAALLTVQTMNYLHSGRHRVAL